MTAPTKLKDTIHRVLAVIIAIVLSPFWIPLVVVWAVFYIVASICIYAAVWLLWLPRSKNILFVYSDSPVWHDYIEQHILPVICERAVVLNWSQRRTRLWRRSLGVAAFKHFGGWRDFNPMGIVFRPFHRAKVFRFHRPFRDYKQAKPESCSPCRKSFSNFHASMQFDRARNQGKASDSFAATSFRRITMRPMQSMSTASTRLHAGSGRRAYLALVGSER